MSTGNIKLKMQFEPSEPLTYLLYFISIFGILLNFREWELNIRFSEYIEYIQQKYIKSDNETAKPAENNPNILFSRYSAVFAINILALTIPIKFQIYKESESGFYTALVLEILITIILAGANSTSNCLLVSGVFLEQVKFIEKQYKKGKWPAANEKEEQKYESYLTPPWRKQKTSILILPGYLDFLLFKKAKKFEAFVEKEKNKEVNSNETNNNP